MTQALQDLVRRRRIELGMTQVELSERAGMSQEWASGVERGKIKHPRRDSLLRLADALGISHAEIVVAAGFAPTRHAAHQLLEQEDDAAQDAVEALHAELDPYLRRIAGQPMLADRLVKSVRNTVELLEELSPPPPTATGAGDDAESPSTPDGAPVARQGR